MLETKVEGKHQAQSMSVPQPFWDVLSQTNQVSQVIVGSVMDPTHRTKQSVMSVAAAVFTVTAKYATTIAQQDGAFRNRKRWNECIIYKNS